MKTSNRIITAFFVFVVGSTLTLFVVTKHYVSKQPNKTVTTTSQLKPFSVAVIENCQLICTVTGGKTNQLRVTAADTIKNSVTDTYHYAVRNDTLFLSVSNASSIEQLPKITLTCTKLHSLILRHSNVGINGFRSDNFSVMAVKSIVSVGMNWHDSDNTLSCQFKHFNFVGKSKSHLFLSKCSLGRLNLKLDESGTTVENACNIEVATVKLVNRSKYNTQKTSNNARLTLSADYSSSYELTNH